MWQKTVPTGAVPDRERVRKGNRSWTRYKTARQRERL
nr:MAG TPA: hypothetical protein [Caudoviricetes sp.]